MTPSGRTVVNRAPVVVAFTLLAWASGCRSEISGATGERPAVSGVRYEGPNGWSEYIAGDAPLVIVAPHGGTLAPSVLRERRCDGCETANDIGTQELARAVADAFAERTGVRPHLVINRLHRRLFDGNRDLPEASDGQPALASTFAFMHNAIDSAAAQIGASYRRGVVIDLHGHAHDGQRIELGYLIDGAVLARSDGWIDSADVIARSSIAGLAAELRGQGASLLRGPTSLGALLHATGYPTVPSPAIGAPLVGEPYFEGGYNTRRHGSASGGRVDAIQVEANYRGVRDTPAARTQFAAALADALVRYLDLHYRWR